MKELLKIRDFMKEMRRPSASSPSSLILFMMALAMMMLVPSEMKGVTTTMNFSEAASSKQYYETRFSLTQGDNYSAISGAKVGGTVTYRNQGGSGDLSFDISRVAFAYNSNAGIYDNEESGFYMYAERIGNWYRGLYAGRWGNQLAVLNLKPGDKVKFTYTAAAKSYDENNHQYNANFQNVTYGGWFDQATQLGQTVTYTVNISKVGDLIVSPNKGTILQSITIESNVAEYDITTVGNTTTFEFTKDGFLEDNDFAIPYMSVSFGNASDYLVVQNNKQAHMYNNQGNENLLTNGVTGIPYGGNFYAFKATSSGTVYVEGGLQGDQIHLFVYNTVDAKWENITGEGLFYKKTYYQNDSHYINFSFDVLKNRIYYICQDNLHESGNAFHLHKFSFTNTFTVSDLAKIVDNVDGYDANMNNGYPIQLIQFENQGGIESIRVKRCSANISPSSLTATINQHGWLYMSKPTFAENTDHAGTVIWDVKTDGGDVTVVVTFPYHASFDVTGDDKDPNRTYGHTWNFVDPRLSDSNIGNCYIRNGAAGFNTGTTKGYLSIGQYKDPNSDFRDETDKREWTYSQRQTGMSGGFHDPFYRNVYDMVGDNADMIWETEGLWFDTETNLSVIYNEKNPLAWDTSKKPNEQVGNPLNFVVPRLLKDDGVSLADPIGYEPNGDPKYEDPDRYVGILPDAGGASSFTIPGLKKDDRVLIFMKSGEGSGDNGIFLNIEGAKDALGNPITSSDLYKAGGTNWQHNRYEGCYHFIKDDNVDAKTGYGTMKFTMVGGSMCKLMYIHIYTGERIVTTNIVSSTSDDSGKLLFINDKGAELGSNGSGSNMSLRFRGKGQHQKTRVLTSSGNLNYSTSELKKNETTNDSHFTVSGDYSQSVSYTSKVGEIGMFRMREMDVEYSAKYVADFCDRNFTVGYRDKVDYPYTWDFTDIQGSSQDALTNEASNYPIDAASQDEYGDEWDISLFDANGNMKVNTGCNPITNNLIFSPHKIGFGNQLWAGDGVIPETRGLWFYSEDDSKTGYTSEYSSSLYNDCLQITSEGIRFANVPDTDGKRVPWWNYKMVVPDVPADAAVYLRMKRDPLVDESDKKYSIQDGKDVLFLNTRFHFGTAAKTSLTEDNAQGVYLTKENGTGYSFYQVPSTTDETDKPAEYILAVKNTTGETNHLTFTLNGWIVEKVGVSLDPKAIGKTGYATESRARRIDHSLTSFLTGKDIKGYTASYGTTTGSTGSTTPDYSRVVLTEFTNKSKTNLAASTDGQEHGGCILYHAGGTSTDRSVSVLDGGFHLFVPDMHDGKDADGNDITTNDVDVSNNILIAFNPTKDACALTNLATGYIGTDAANGDKILVLSAKRYKYGTNGADVKEGYDVSFVRVDPKGNNNQGASLKDCSAYIKMPANQMKVLSDNNGEAKSIIVFYDDPFGQDEGIATAIENAELQKDVIDGNAVWYNLNGQKLSGMPTSSGLYIVNGKKVFVK